MDFDKRKAATLASLSSSSPDKSPKGTVDAPIIPLLQAINSHPCFYTTSSCSGRISILATPKPLPNSPSPPAKARGGSWLFITHDYPAHPDSILPLLFCPPDPAPATTTSDLVFRFEPLIVAVECRDVEAASSLVALAVRSGFRESGITSAGKRVIVGIRSSIRMEVPLGDSGSLLVSPDYVRFLVGLANEKMEANRKRAAGFLDVLRENGFVGSSNAASDGEGDDGLEKRENGNAGDSGLMAGVVTASSCSLSFSRIAIVGEPVEKLFTWGHSTSVLDQNQYDILVFGGFGGPGRHARRNETLLLDPSSGALKSIDVKSAPSPRIGHTASLVGGFVFVIGGRADPLHILNDVWVFDIDKKEWSLTKCIGHHFLPRHRHAAAVVGSKIYVFGGLNNDTIFSSLHALDTKTMHWEEVSTGGEGPCARHSHSMVAYGSTVFVFGGYNGEKAFGDLFSFDAQEFIWKEEKMGGRSPHARFSHSMFVYKHFLGIVGGCPVGQNFQELALLDLQLQMWKHVSLDYISKELLVRSTANVVGDDLVVIGGGAACYAFGTKFSEPFKINLVPLMTSEDKIMPAAITENHPVSQYDGVNREKNVEIVPVVLEEIEMHSPGLNFNDEERKVVTRDWVLKVNRRCGKLGKDILKKFGWLDLGRKVYTQEDGLHICFPVTDKFCALFLERKQKDGETLEQPDEINLSKQFTGEGVILSEISCSTALNFLKECGATTLLDEVSKIRRSARSPFQMMHEAVASLIKQKGLPTDLLEQLPARWERLGDIAILPVTCFKDQVWDSIGEELWPIIAKTLGSRRLARQGRVASTGTRDSTLEILVGNNGWVDHRENGILYSFDATKCMFSWGNLSEKLRMGNQECATEVAVDLFAGIGYFVLPFLVRARAKLVYACEWNPHAVEALKRNLDANSVSDRCIVLEGDNRMTAPRGVADRVCLGLLPTSEGSWVTAVRALRNEGGMLHVHGNVKDSEESLWTKHVVRSMEEIAKSEGRCWEVSVEHVERVKWYAPHIRHLVADVRCKQIVR
ncbi:hypothetical protein Tsubulata_025157 [Turnera subulata]|uniref:SAM-dependent methyltransferase TRM5/TYW2-type domain-containing protein n=1 Tax=Turnera subulata TaxID=218843 RepID=A0A9Q0FE97_9ROSI|nr:hypothetical protein Tsubulata_025157 [Turnera subulata]